VDQGAGCLSGDDAERCGRWNGRPAIRTTSSAGAGWHIMDFFLRRQPRRTWTSVRTSAFSALTAADLVLKRRARAAYCALPPAGATMPIRSAPGGFCLSQQCGDRGAASQDQACAGSRSSIIDVHHGNGTQEIFYDRPDVLTVSIHGDPANYYPFFYGYGDQRGRGCRRRPSI